MLTAETIKKAQMGDAEAFKQLYHAHKRHVFGLCLRMTRNVTTAEDLTQDVFLQVHRKLQTFRSESTFSTWLHRVVVNIVLMQLRVKAPVETPLEEWSSPYSDEGSQHHRLRQEFQIEDRVLRGSIDRITLERAIDELPPGYRMVFTLHDVHGFEHNEIADILDCSMGTTKSQLHKARMKLRSLLSPALRGVPQSSSLKPGAELFKSSFRTAPALQVA